MKNIIKCFFFFLLITSCEENLDINTDPNSPQAIDKRFALTSAQGSLATVTGGVLANLGGFLAQYHTQSPGASQYTDIDTYNMNIDFSNRLWDELYAGCLTDLEYVITESQEDGDTGSLLIATLLKAYTFQVLTDIYGDIPYTEALQGAANITPATSLGEDVYTGLISDIDAALAIYNSNPVDSTVGIQDAIYNADMEDWVKFSNTLKLKLYLRMAYTPQANAAAVVSLLNEDNFITTDAKFALYDATAGANKVNPFYDVQIDDIGDVNNIASNSLLQFFEANADPRLTAVYRLNDVNLFLGIDQGDRANYVSNAARNYSRPNVLPDTPVYLFTVSESNFLQAEAIIRYANGTGAKAKYDRGILNSFLTYNLDEDSAQLLTNTGGTYEYVPSANVETAIRQVMIQKWASLAYINNIEAFFELNRTKYPELTTLGSQDYAVGNLIVSTSSVLSGLQTPNSLFYPDTEESRNPNIIQKGSITEKIWWDMKL